MYRKKNILFSKHSFILCNLSSKFLGSYNLTRVNVQHLYIMGRLKVGGNLNPEVWNYVNDYGLHL